MKLSIPMLELAFAIAIWIMFAVLAAYGSIRFVLYTFTPKDKRTFPISVVFLPAFVLMVLYIH